MRHQRDQNLKKMYFFQIMCTVLTIGTLFLSCFNTHIVSFIMLSRAEYTFYIDTIFYFKTNNIIQKIGKTTLQKF